MSPGRIDLVEEEVAVGSGLRVRIARPRAPEALLDEAVSSGADDAPYWAELWPSALALAAALAAQDLEHVRAVELGCGLALPAVVASLRGADVLAVDHDAAAVQIAQANGTAAGQRLHGLVGDLLGPAAELVAAGPFDLVLAADVLYDEALAHALARLIPRLTAPSGRALVAFPWPGQADPLARSLAAAGMTVALGELAVPGMPQARRVGLLEASGALAANATK